mmetsp:Transcript_7600/g.6967  ORF Transcript_7600/g.6967 Transcript_7600/m.6967 type:complete len:122 (+) Transcript_7600:313-678(+)
MIHQINNLSFSINQDHSQFMCQEKAPSKNPLVLMDQSYEEDDEQPFYIFDHAEDYEGFDLERSAQKPKDLKQQMVEAVKQKIFSDPEYRKQLLKRVLPQFEKFNDSFTNSFIYRMKSNQQP